MIVRTGLGQALACPPGTTDPSCAASPVFERKPPVYAPSAEMLQIQKAGMDVPDLAVIDPRQALGQVGTSVSTIAWGLAAVAVVILVVMSFGRSR